MRLRDVGITLAAATCFATLALTGISASTPAQAASTPTWLSTLNHWRSYWNVPAAPLSVDATLSADDKAHADYLLQNKTCGHAEDPSKPGYSDAGAHGGGNSVVYCDDYDKYSDAVSNWVQSPFHGEQVLNPRLTITGYGENAHRAVLETLDHANDAPAPTQPLTWPNGDEVSAVDDLGDYSEITQDCGKDYDTGVNLSFPLFVILPDDAHDAVPASPSDVWLKDDAGNDVPFCLIDSASPVKPFVSTAILIPEEQDFVHGGSASFSAGGYTATWRFAVGCDDMPYDPQHPDPTPSGTAPAPQLHWCWDSSQLHYKVITSPAFVGKTVYYYRRSGMTHKVVPLGTAKVDKRGHADRQVDAAPGQILSAYAKIGGLSSQDIASPYSNTIAFKIPSS